MTDQNTNTQELNEVTEATVEQGAQPADTPNNDENGDGLKAGHATADVPGDVLGL